MTERPDFRRLMLFFAIVYVVEGIGQARFGIIDWNKANADAGKKKAAPVKKAKKAEAKAEGKKAEAKKAKPKAKKPKAEAEE